MQFIMRCIGFTINDTKIANMLKESVFTIQEFPFLAPFFEAMIKENNDQKYFYKMNISHYLSSLVIELLRILNESLVEDNQSQLINKIIVPGQKLYFLLFVSVMPFPLLKQAIS